MLALDPNAQISSSTEVNQGIVEIPIDENKPDGNKPSGFNTELWNLLREIKAAGVSLRGKVAEYAGFYIKIGNVITTEWDPTSDNGTKPDVDQTWTSQPNKSLDKLTFMIMFRLPFRGEVVTVKPSLVDPELDLYNNRKIVKNTVNGVDTYVVGAFHEKNDDDFEDSKLPPVSFRSCTITRPNAITGFDIGGKDLFYDTQAKNFYVVYPPYLSNYFGDPMANATEAPLPAHAATGTWSSRANIIRQLAGLKRLNGAGEQVHYIGGNYIHVDDAGNPVSFDYSTPATADTANAYTYYEIDFNNLYPGSSRPEYIDATEQDTIDAIKTLPLYYFLTVYTENRPWKYRPVEKTGFVRGAHFPENKKNPVPNVADTNVLWRTNTKGGSGLTFGFGLDTGGNYVNSYVYQIVFTIKKRTGAIGNLAYADRVEPISSISTGALLKSAISRLIGIHEDQIQVTDLASFPGYAAGWAVVLERGMYRLPGSVPPKYYSDKSGYLNVYSTELKYAPAVTEAAGNVFIDSPTDSARYAKRTTLPSENLQTFKTLLNKFYSTNNYASPNEQADGLHLKDFNINNSFNDALDHIFGLLGGPAGVIYWNNQAVFSKFQMPLAKRTIVKNYELFFIDKYYKQNTLQARLLGLIQSGALPNVMEKTLYASLQYASPGPLSIKEYATTADASDGIKDSKGKYQKLAAGRFDPGIWLAVSSHNPYELVSVFKDRIPTQPDRRDHRVAYVKKFQHILNRGVEA